MVHFDITRPVSQQLDWLERVRPNYPLTHPTNLHAVVRLSEETELRIPTLREVATLGEILEPEVRVACERAWGLAIVDAYSSFEVGMIALQCPQHPHYHVQAENLLIGILDDTGKPCAPGEIGRVVLTDLHNFAMPLIRYEIGDYAEFGPPCSCRRGLPVIKRVLGRPRNMLTLPSGEKFWPVFHNIFIDALAKSISPLREAQLV